MARIVGFLFAISTLLAVFSCGSSESEKQPGAEESVGTANNFALRHEVVTKGADKVLRVSLTNDWGTTYKVKISKLYYKLYETTDKLPIEMELVNGATFEHDFTFLPEAWDTDDTGMQNIVTAEFSGDSAAGSFKSNNVNVASIALSWSLTGPEKDMVFFSDTYSPRAVEIQVMSIIENRKELLRKPLDLRVEPGGRVRIPHVSRRKKPTLSYLTRLVPNKRWSELQSYTVE